MRPLILCTGNPCRSQMAEAILSALDPTLEVHSEDTAPARQVHPHAPQVLEEISIRHDGGRFTSVERSLGQAFDRVLTVCDHAEETLPVFTGALRMRPHIGFDDAANAAGTDEEILDVFSRVRDELRAHFETFVRTELTGGRN